MPRDRGDYSSERRAPSRPTGQALGRTVDYKEIDVIRRYLTTSSKLMSRKRAGTTTQEQRSLKQAVKNARFLALIPYRGA